jgi:hypothetical protein
MGRMQYLVQVAFGTFNAPKVYGTNPPLFDSNVPPNRWGGT